MCEWMSGGATYNLWHYLCVYMCDSLPNPSQASDTDPRLSVSGMQQFQGEDLNYEGRKQDQQEQRR